VKASTPSRASAKMKSVRSRPAIWAARSCEIRPRAYQWTADARR